MSRNLIYRLFVLSVGLILSWRLSAQNGPEMADDLRSEGKIYVVVGVFLLISAGILVYLIVLDLRLKKIEKEKSENKNLN